MLLLGLPTFTYGRGESKRGASEAAAPKGAFYEAQMRASGEFAKALQQNPSMSAEERKQTYTKLFAEPNAISEKETRLMRKQLIGAAIEGSMVPLDRDIRKRVPPDVEAEAKAVHVPKGSIKDHPKASEIEALLKSDKGKKVVLLPPTPDAKSAVTQAAGSNSSGKSPGAKPPTAPVGRKAKVDQGPVESGGAKAVAFGDEDEAYDTVDSEPGAKKDPAAKPAAPAKAPDAAKPKGQAPGPANGAADVSFH